MREIVEEYWHVIVEGVVSVTIIAILSGVLYLVTGG